MASPLEEQLEAKLGPVPPAKPPLDRQVMPGPEEHDDPWKRLADALRRSSVTMEEAARGLRATFGARRSR